VTASSIFALCIELAACTTAAEAPTPRAVFQSSVFVGTHSGKECGQTGSWFKVGSFGAPELGTVDPNNASSDLASPPRPVEDGAAEQQGTATIACSVRQDGDVFKIYVSIALTGATGGAAIVAGNLTDTRGDQKNISLSLTRGGESYTDTTCVAQLSEATTPAIAPGRVWFRVRCPKAENNPAQQVCESSAEFRLERCVQ